VGRPVPTGGREKEDFATVIRLEVSRFFGWSLFWGKNENFRFCTPTGEKFARGGTKIPLPCQGEQITLNDSG
jgi:hypothetical protein